MKNALQLLQIIYYDAAAKCTANVSNIRDIATIVSRSKHEGMSFFTITLPSFAKDFDIALSQGEIDPLHFRSFKKCKRAPAFLQGFLGQVFDVRTGRILDEPEIAAIEGIRQIGYCFKKLKELCSVGRVRRELYRFIENERVFDCLLETQDTNDFNSVSAVLWNEVLRGLPTASYPKHGPGATSERRTGNSKFLEVKWHERLEGYFPFTEYLLPSLNALDSEYFESIKVLSAHEETPVRVVPVPKTAKKPRIIAIEPVCNQYIQQAIAASLIPRLESHRLTSGHINFTNQEVNRALAISSSSDGYYATLDLSSASDNVPFALALSMFSSHPDLMGAVEACRSREAEIPLINRKIRLRKFASMGSALCFPIEAMYFYTICIIGLLRSRSLSISLRNINKVRRDIYVYGDDIIIPTREAEVVISTLHKYFCKVNVRKSFFKGKFRESCGMDAFNGEEVTPTYIKSNLDNERSASWVLSTIEASNHFYLKGYWRTSDYLNKLVRRHCKFNLPIVGSTCPGIGLKSFQRVTSVHRWNRRLQRFEIRTLVPSPVYVHDPLEGWPALQKCLLQLEMRGSRDAAQAGCAKDHLLRTARFGTVTLKRRWVPPA